MKNIIALLVLCIGLSACSDSEEVKLGFNGIDNVESIRKAMPSGGKIAHPKNGEEVSFAIGALVGVQQVNANGVAQTHVYENGASLHTAQVNIERPEDGYFYEGWLVKGDEVISTGHAKSRFGDVRHFIQFETEKDLTNFTKVVITLEPDDGDPAPATHVAEGELQYRQR